MAWKHGTAGGYTNHRCRCDDCRRAWSEDHARRTAERAALLAADPGLAPHGSASTYRNYLCRCTACVLANRVTVAARYAASKAG
jgi:hypothetical protein